MKLFRQLAWFFHRYRGRYAVALLLLVLVDIIILIPPKLVGEIIDHIRFGTLTPELLYQPLLLIFAIAIAAYLLRYGWRVFLFGGSLKLEKLMRSKLFAHLVKMPPSFYNKKRSGDLLALATNDIPAVEMSAGFGVLTLADSLIVTVITLAVMLQMISWQLTLAALLPLPFLAWATGYYGKLLHTRFFEAQQAFGKMNDHVQESVSGIRVLRSFVQEEKDTAAFARITREVMDKNIRVARIDALFEPTIIVIINLSFLIGIGYGATLVFESKISLGELVAFNLYLGQLIWPMFAIGFLMNITQRGSASLQRLDELFAHQSDVEDAADAITGDDGVVACSIEMRGFSFVYPEAHEPTLKDISFALQQGSTLGVVGRTGSGKSTLLRQFLRFYPLPENSLFIGGIAEEKIPLSVLRGMIGYVPQEHMLFSKTILQNITFAVPEASREQIADVIKGVSLEQDLAHLPAGLDTLVGEKGVMLSGGQKQRIAIARAMLADPPLLILDDALSAVDAQTEERILNYIRRKRKGKTTLIAAHRLSAVSHADLILVLDEGKITERGTHQQLLAQNGWYARQYRIQQIEQWLAAGNGGNVS